MRERKFRHLWQRTWADAADDFTAWDGDRNIGRVRLHNAGSARFWRWHFGVDEVDAIDSANGSETDRDTACHALEATYAAWQ